MQEKIHAELQQYKKIMMAGKKLQGNRNGWREDQLIEMKWHRFRVFFDPFHLILSQKQMMTGKSSQKPTAV